MKEIIKGSYTAQLNSLIARSERRASCRCVGELTLAQVRTVLKLARTFGEITVRSADPIVHRGAYRYPALSRSLTVRMIDGEGAILAETGQISACASKRCPGNLQVKAGGNWLGLDYWGGLSRCGGGTWKAWKVGKVGKV